MKRKALIILALIAAVLLASAAQAQEIPDVSSVLTARDTVRAKYLYVRPSNLTLRLGSNGGHSHHMSATAAPVRASQSFSWKSRNTNVATVDPSKGIVTATGIGQTYVVCSTLDGSGIRKLVKVTVKPLQVSAVTFEKDEYQMAPNSSAAIPVTLTPENAYNKKVIWSSSNPNVAYVDQQGNVTVRKLGSCVISCVSPSSGKSAKARINATLAASDIYCVAIGQENYINSSILRGCKADADRFSATVGANSFGSDKKPVIQVKYNLTGDGIRTALADIPGMGMTESDVTYVFYSGHGFGSSNMRGALVGIDYAGLATAESTLVTVSQIRERLDRIPGTVVLVVDACYSGQLITSESTVKSAAKSVSSAPTDAQMDMFTQSFVSAFSSNANVKSIVDGNELAKKYKLIVACQPDEQSYLAGNGFGSMFTKYVTLAGGVSGMNTGSIIVSNKLPADTNGDKTVSVKEIYAYSYNRILNALKRTFKSAVKQHMMVWPVSDPYPVFARLS